MVNKLKYIFLFFICTFIVFYGFITVSNVMPDFIKDRSSFKVTYTSKPFDLEFDVGDYIVYLNSKTVENYKTEASNLAKKLLNK